MMTKYLHVVDAKNDSGNNTQCGRGSPVETRQSLRSRSPAKWEHLGMMGTPVWCLPWTLRYLSASHGSGCSGRPGRVGYLGYPAGT
ncbi:hypothetical protein TIFTF001_020427 [Ficus carica]|uniref:Uncharacterized protein n=1 Tax=Ficus carica TaxID=3494 RepID=A0AA88ADN9_FICCA|nr:hypothetical protein TIFTF001_020427 [Ficus carica]